MLCLAEGTFDEIMNKKGAFAIYENVDQMTLIIYDEDAILDFKKEPRSTKNHSLFMYSAMTTHTTRKILKI